jgi:phosphatidylglycerophosphate synthase
MNLKLDDRFTSFVLSRTSIFSHVHPNLLTLTGLAADFVVLYAAANANVFLLFLMLFVRYSCDCLDGAVARKYKKVSSIGGALDTISDNTFIFIVTLSITNLMDLTYGLGVAFAVTGANLAYLWHAKALVHHNNIKLGGNWVQNIYSFGVNNNVLLYGACFVTLWGLM